MSVPIIQYLPLTRPRASHRFVQKLDRINVMSILDLEDSAQDPFDLEKTRKLKINAREGLVYISKKCKWSISSKIYIRLNSNNTEFFEEDLKAVIAAKKNEMPVTGVFLPKVENYAQIQKVHDIFIATGIDLEIVPMIETALGVENLSSLLKEDKNKALFERVHYGHFDYCLDAKIWPFSEPNHKEFWSVILPIVEKLNHYKKGYVHTPFPFLYNEQLFWQVNEYLSKLPIEQDVWSCTLNSELSLSKQPQEISELSIIEPSWTQDQIVRNTYELCENFLGGRANERSFGVSKELFIPPHQYFSAKNYLAELEEHELEGSKDV